MSEARWWHLGTILQVIAVLIAVRAGLLVMGFELTIPYLDPLLTSILEYLKKLGYLIVPNL